MGESAAGRAWAGRAWAGRAWAIRRAAASGLPWAALRPFSKALSRMLRWPGNVRRARQLLHRLSALADHELRDIGLTRRDLDVVRTLPLDADPSAALTLLAEERRTRRRVTPGSARPPGGPP